MIIMSAIDLRQPSIVAPFCAEWLEAAADPVCEEEEEGGGLGTIRDEAAEEAGPVVVAGASEKEAEGEDNSAAEGDSGMWLSLKDTELLLPTEAPPTDTLEALRVRSFEAFSSACSLFSRSRSGRRCFSGC